MKNISIRPETSEDIEAIYVLNIEVFDTDAEARLVNALRDSRKLVLSLVALLGENVVGHIAFSEMKLANQGRRKLVGLGPMAVSKANQRQGIGSRLISDSEKRLKAMGYDAIFLLGHKEYYPKFGFQPSFPNFGINSKYKVANEYFMAKAISDRGLTGLSGTVFYQEEFDNL